LIGNPTVLYGRVTSPAGPTTPNEPYDPSGPGGQVFGQGGHFEPISDEKNLIGLNYETSSKDKALFRGFIVHGNPRQFDLWKSNNGLHVKKSDFKIIGVKVSKYRFFFDEITFECKHLAKRRKNGKKMTLPDMTILRDYINREGHYILMNDDHPLKPEQIDLIRKNGKEFITDSEFVDFLDDLKQSILDTYSRRVKFYESRCNDKNTYFLLNECGDSRRKDQGTHNNFDQLQEQEGGEDIPPPLLGIEGSANGLSCPDCKIRSETEDNINLRLTDFIRNWHNDRDHEYFNSRK